MSSSRKPRFASTEAVVQSNYMVALTRPSKAIFSRASIIALTDGGRWIKAHRDYNISIEKVNPLFFEQPATPAEQQTVRSEPPLLLLLYNVSISCGTSSYSSSVETLFRTTCYVYHAGRKYTPPWGIWIFGIMWRLSGVGHLCCA